MQINLEANEQVQLVLSGAQLGLILTALQAGPYREVKDTIDTLNTQLQAHAEERNARSQGVNRGRGRPARGGAGALALAEKEGGGALPGGAADPNGSGGTYEPFAGRGG